MVPDSQGVDELVDGARAAGPGEDDGVVLGGVDGVPHDVPRLVPEHCCLHGGHGGRGVRVGVERQHLGADEVLDEGERSTCVGTISPIELQLDWVFEFVMI